MTTKLYFHEALSLSLTTLPAAQQSALGAPAKTADAVTVNRSMNTTIGTTQTSKVVTTNASASAQVVYFTRFVSEPLNTTSISEQSFSRSLTKERAPVSQSIDVGEDLVMLLAKQRTETELTIDIGESVAQEKGQAGPKNIEKAITEDAVNSSDSHGRISAKWRRIG